MKFGINCIARKSSSEKGQALIETALILPIVFILLLGVLEFAQMLRIQQSLTNASREGARAGAIHLDDATALSTADAVTTDYLTRTGIDLALVTINSSFSVIDGSQAVEVLINYDYASGLAVWIPGLNSSLALNSRAVMRREA